MAVFLTDEWFNEVETMTDEAGDLNLPPSMADTKMNLNITGTANGDVQAYLEDGVLRKGTTDSDTTVTIDADTIKELVQGGDLNAAMGAFMAGKIRIDGDMSKLMALQTVKPSQEQKDLIKKIIAMTESA